MKFINYVKDKIWYVILFIVSLAFILLMLAAFKTKIELTIAILLVITIFFITSILIDFFKKKDFYNNLLSSIENLDKAYLVLETLDKPNFYEGKILYQALYEINKSMSENVKNLKLQVADFKEYVEMWIHEIKIPISSLVLMQHNHKDKFSKDQIRQIKRIENYVEQILYYVRQETAEKDYLITDVSLNKIINKVLLKNKDDILENKINLIVDTLSYDVSTDSKWLEFIINQIINNSIKYKRNIKSSCIKIYVIENNDKLDLVIEDNGLGINETDLPMVFKKSFTGQNGRIKSKSTGMGLFIAKSMTDKLGHKIKIESKEKEYTKVIITFSKNHYYDVVK